MIAVVGTIIPMKCTDTEVKSLIRVENGAVCKGLRNHACGYGWRYREEVMKCSR